MRHRAQYFGTCVPATPSPGVLSLKGGGNDGINLGNGVEVVVCQGGLPQLTALHLLGNLTGPDADIGQRGIRVSGLDKPIGKIRRPIRLLLTTRLRHFSSNPSHCSAEPRLFASEKLGIVAELKDSRHEVFTGSILF